jgi:hypothetical protein
MRTGRPPRFQTVREWVDLYAFPVPECGCWLWSGHLTNMGYGQLKFKGKRIAAHRAAWESYRGPIPKGMFACHKCDTPACVNPDHLYIGTAMQNSRDRIARGRHNAVRLAPTAYCKSGKHLFNEQNVLIEASGARRCKLCLKERSKYRKRDREKFNEYKRIWRKRRKLMSQIAS